MLTYHDFHTPETPFEDKDVIQEALNVLEWSYRSYGDDIVYACSFGIEGIVLIDLINKVKPDARIVFLDTDVHFKETYSLIDEVKKDYPNLRIEMKKADLTLDEQAEKHGDRLWEKNPNLCCKIRKIIPLHSELSHKKAWISGLRQEQSPSRKNVQFLNKDDKFQNIKICPLIHWTWKDVWRYAHKNGLKYNILHDKGYPSIGCEPCTKPAFNEEDIRAGRWSGNSKTECGLHG
ncbi:phosphoadenylyl-sulfate reductase [Metabacillus sp. GX 13764]|uniref:phosphoadenylyl-sulfate reductase n=1 Tax=Metabacillus kandeliae TaxID=2900151 RepID=UPI001E43743E|nr:phosphoadenylyl-sulfate reductase [Metabacillus kandeliae]MCD7033853.1 phosphoadenylyl-sulfate reductase [Metabacillus kandeliae]